MGFLKKAKKIPVKVDDNVKKEAEDWAEKHKEVNVNSLQNEFGNALMKIMPIMKNPFASVDKKRKTLSDMANKLSESSFVTFLPQIIEIINMKKDECIKYKDSETQTQFIIGWFPRMENQHDILVEYVKQAREKCGLSN